MSTERVVRISPTGDEITFLFHDQSPLLSVGEPTIVRASNVRFDNTDKQWYVFVRLASSDGSFTEKRLDKGFASRSEAIDYEIEYCEALLNSEPQTVQGVINAQLQQDKTSG